MIRAIALCLLAALPAAAQDFRGLRPGMPASALGVIGEPFALEQAGNLIYASYPLPFEQRLDVTYTSDGTLVWLSTRASPDAPDPPETGGLQTGIMGLADVANRLSDATETDPFDRPGLIHVREGEPGFTLVYDLPAEPDVVLTLTFYHASFLPPADLIEVAQTPPDDAEFVSANLVYRPYIETAGGLGSPIDGPRTAPIPFPLTIDDAFPSLIP
ncbi:hypothetical protein V8J82_17805 [Gymnodinialimonas sp. 2305UL16-5]|uniref:hypothetical protein n=1 Tax=Gymnodinialimonas mytili TaxID=3126503 RepID=UPI0030A1EED0